MGEIDTRESGRDGILASLTPDEQTKLKEIREIAKKNGNNKKCRDFLSSLGISWESMVNAIDNHAAYSGDRSTISVEEAGYYTSEFISQIPSLGDLARTSYADALKKPINEHLKVAFNGKVGAFRSQTFSNSIFYRRFKSGVVFHESVHLASNLSDIALANKLGLGEFKFVDDASRALNKALDANDCPHD